eukprot:192977_1
MAALKAYAKYSLFNQPDIGHRRINIFGSLSKGTDFDCEYLYVNFEFDFPSSKYTIVDYGEQKSNLKYSTACSYYMKLNNQKIYNFSSVFELEILESLSEKKIFDVSPKIYFEVNSVDYWNRHRIEGYGSVNIELDNNNYNKQISIPIWRPIGTMKDEIRRFFIGGGMRLKDKKSVSIPANNVFNARLHWNTIQTGNIYMNMSIVSTFNQTDMKKQINKTIIIHSPQNRDRHGHNRQRKTKLSKLINVSDDTTKSINPTRPKHHKRKKTSKLLQKMHLSDS